MSVDSPNFEGLDRWATDAVRIEKPWGSELIWAHTEQYVGKTLFVSAGQSLSLQFHNVKDESWYVLCGQGVARARRAGPADPQYGGGRRRRDVPFPARHGAPGDGARGHDDHRGLDAAPRRRRAARGQYGAGGGRTNLDTNVVTFARARAEGRGGGRAGRLVAAHAALPRAPRPRHAPPHLGRLPPVRSPGAQPASVARRAAANGSTSRSPTSSSRRGSGASRSSGGPSTAGSPAPTTSRGSSGNSASTSGCWPRNRKDQWLRRSVTT